MESRQQWNDRVARDNSEVFLVFSLPRGGGEMKHLPGGSAANSFDLVARRLPLFELRYSGYYAAAINVPGTMESAERIPPSGLTSPRNG